MRNRSGYTLIEMLTVIGIIAILTGIIYPVFLSVKEKTRQGSCMSNMRTLWTGITLYAKDQKAYPDHLLYRGMNENGDIAMTGLYPVYIKELPTFTCPVSSYVAPTVTPVSSLLPNGTAETANLYGSSSYDVGFVNGTPELRYTINRNIARTDANFTRQLMFRDAPSNTVVTWCSYHRKSPNYVVEPRTNDIVLWLNGQAKSVPSAEPAVQGVLQP